MSDAVKPVNQALEDSIIKASTGELEDLKAFFRAVISGPLYVPERYQDSLMTGAPAYPNDFVNILGVQDGERVIVPAFSNVSHISEWCGQELKYKQFSGSKFFEVLPEGWWFCLNPGQEIEKEFSPWEVDKLKGGEEFFDEIICELYSDEIIDTLEITHLGDDEYEELSNKIRDFAKSKNDILKVLVAKERGKTLDDKVVEKLLVGLEIDSLNPEVVESTKNSFADFIKPFMIGDLEMKIYAAAIGNNIVLGVFREIEPLYVSSANKS